MKDIYNEQVLFVWRSSNTYYLEGDYCDFSEIDKKTYYSCPFCNISLINKTSPDCTLTENYRKCMQCGFNQKRYIRYRNYSNVIGQAWLDTSILRNFSINDPKLALRELGSHLRRQFSDIYSVKPRRFEELVADVFRQLGYHCRLTQLTRDGGVDIILLEKNTNNQIVVECKRYAKHRKVDVGIVRQFLGVCRNKYCFQTGSNLLFDN